MNSKLFRQLVWDYSLSQEDFESILAGKKQLAKLDQSWAIARVLEQTNYYQAIKLVSPIVIKNNWSKIKPKLFNKTISDGYEYILHHPTLSPTG